MKVLFFHATSRRAPEGAPAFDGSGEGHPSPLQPLPRQAIHTAKQRQFRYQLPWERVRNLLALRLDPQDSRLRVPRRRPGTIITNWPADRDPDLQQFAFVVNRGVPVRVEPATRVPTGLLVRAEPPLAPADSLLWCGTSCELAQEGESLPPRQVVGDAGRPLELVGTPLAEGDDHWVLVVRGQHGDCDLRIDGEEVEAQAMSPFDGLRRVLDRESRSFDVSGELLRTEEPPAAGPSTVTTASASSGARRRRPVGAATGCSSCRRSPPRPTSSSTRARPSAKAT
jgi:hypothetical protein